MTTFNIEACHPLCMSMHESRGDCEQLSIKPGKGIGGWDIWGPADEEVEARKSGL